MNDDRRFDTARYETQRVYGDTQHTRHGYGEQQYSQHTYGESQHTYGESQHTQGGARGQQSSGPRRLSSSQREALKRKGRIRRFFLRLVLWVLFVAASSLALSGIGWLLANDFCAFNKTPYVEASVDVTKDDDLDSITDKLKDKGLIEYKWFFKLFGKVAHAESKIGIGTYELNTQMDYSALINGMRNKNAALNSETVRVTIKEGYNVRQIIALLAQYGVNTEDELTDAAKNYDFDYPFIDKDKKGDITRLEGYLFPDTYEFYVGGSASAALGKLVSNFSAKMEAELADELEASGRSLKEIVTIASLIEKETDGHDRANISSVIYNRLNNIGETYHLLQIDASLIYGLGTRYTGKLTQSDLDYDTPYNLHMHEGLPPTPIANPGLASLRAALEPAETGYFFYALSKDGSHHFFKTYNEFLKFVNSSDYAG